MVSHSKQKAQFKTLLCLRRRNHSHHNDGHHELTFWFSSLQVKSPGIQSCNVGQVISEALYGTEVEGTTVLRNLGSHSPIDASHITVNNVFNNAAVRTANLGI